MKKVLTLILVFWCSAAWAVEPINLARGFNPYVAGAGVTAVCSASYGSDLATATNATDSGYFFAQAPDADADATTGWTAHQTPAGGVLSSETAPSQGTSHLDVTADGANDGVYRNFSGLSGSTVYRLTFDVRHNGTGLGWGCWLAYGNFGIGVPVNTAITSTSYATQTIYFQYVASALQTLICKENNGSDDGGIYLDKYSVQAATLCYGNELHASDAAALSSEANSVGAWTNTASTTLTSVTTDPQDGSYHLSFDANGVNGGAATFDMSSVCSEGVKYFISWKVKGVSGDVGSCGVGDSLGPSVNAPTTSAWTNPGFSFTYTAAGNRYFRCKENGASNNSVLYIDSLSIKEIASE